VSISLAEGERVYRMIEPQAIPLMDALLCGDGRFCTHRGATDHLANIKTLE
jgi:hypothetical protein